VDLEATWRSIGKRLEIDQRYTREEVAESTREGIGDEGGKLVRMVLPNNESVV
jgi:hypothetical protein